jgi:hypothetical protein
MKIFPLTAPNICRIREAGREGKGYAHMEHNGERGGGVERKRMKERWQKSANL